MNAPDNRHAASRELAGRERDLGTFAAKTVFENLDELRSAVGSHLGVSDWVEITQERVNLFANATGDNQWIHVDVERATAESPYGGPIAHGYLTLSLTNMLLPTIVDVRGAAMGVNYGCGKVRFPSAVPVGSRVRASAVLTAVDDVAGGVQTTMTVTMEIDGRATPACVVESISRWMA